MAKRKRLNVPDEPVNWGKQIPPAWAHSKTLKPAPIASVTGEASAAAALQEVSDAMNTARAEGRLVLRVPLDAIDAEHLVRDRLPAEDEAFESLLTSLKARGQQTPVEAVDLGQGRYGLISGWRRITALRKLHTETGEARFAEALLFLRRPAEAHDAYVAMVEENEIRVGLSYYERARIALKSVEEGVFPDLKLALQGLFGSVSRAKRSKIKSFVPIVEALDDSLRHPTAIGERLGLTLSKRLAEEPGFGAGLANGLREAGTGSVEAEQSMLTQALRVPPSATAALAKRAGSADKALGPGIRMQVRGDAVRLAGPGVDEKFVSDLTEFVKSRLAALR